MLQKLDATKKQGNSHISILYPGLDLSKADTGYFSIGRIDQAHIGAGAVIKMHPHINDDILSYFRSGKVKHLDSEGFQEDITPGRLMLMKAGKIFHHEEAVEKTVEGLQIFIRPGKKDNKPEVLFDELESIYSDNKWRLIASPDKTKTRLQLSSETSIYDSRLVAGNELRLPATPSSEKRFLLYVFQGSVTVNHQIELAKADSLLIDQEDVLMTTGSEAELVLFQTDIHGPYYDGGMYSGNRYLD